MLEYTKILKDNLQGQFLYTPLRVRLPLRQYFEITTWQFHVV